MRIAAFCRIRTHCRNLQAATHTNCYVALYFFLKFKQLKYMETINIDEIRKAASDRSIYYESDTYCDFMAGAEFAIEKYEEKLRWIPVEERMPDYGVEVFVKYEDTLGTIHPNPAYTVDYAVATSHSKKGFSIEVDYSGRTKEKVTHWHPISFL